MSTISIVPCKAEDVGQLRQLILEHIVFQGQTEADLRLSEAQLRKDLSDGYAGAWLAMTAEGKAVGELMYCQTYSGAVGRILHVEELYIQPAARRSGLGGRLWEALEKDARSRGIKRINWQCLGWNEPALNFYRSQGGESMTEKHGNIGFRLSGAALKDLATHVTPEEFDIQGLDLLDEERWEELSLATRRLYQDELGLDAPMLKAEEKLADLKGGRAWMEVAVDGRSGALLGFSLACWHYSSWEGRFIWLEDLYVMAEGRRRGVGKALIASLARLCLSQGLSRLQWEAIKGTPAVQFYHHLGAIDLNATENILQMGKYL